jgi:hypothetical protein
MIRKKIYVLSSLCFSKMLWFRKRGLRWGDLETCTLGPAPSIWWALGGKGGRRKRRDNPWQVRHVPEEDRYSSRNKQFVGMHGCACLYVVVRWRLIIHEDCVFPSKTAACTVPEPRSQPVFGSAPTLWPPSDIETRIKNRAHTKYSKCNFMTLETPLLRKPWRNQITVA